MTIYGNPTRIKDWLDCIGYGHYAAYTATVADSGTLELHGLTQERMLRMGLPLCRPTTDGEESAICSCGEEGFMEERPLC